MTLFQNLKTKKPTGYLSQQNKETNRLSIPAIETTTGGSHDCFSILSSWKNELNIVYVSVNFI